MRRSDCEGPRSAPADPGRWYWCCDGARYNPLLDRARRIAASQTLDALADQLRALELAWIHAQLSDEDRLALLELHHRRHRELDPFKPKGPRPEPRALRLPVVPRRQGCL